MKMFAYSPLFNTLRAASGVAMIALSTFAHAHAYPTHQSPGAGATVSPAPQQVNIDFNEGVEPAFSAITVTNAQGQAVSDGKATVDPSARHRLSVALKSLTPGVYTVSWVAVATDSHRTQGHYAFTVK